jgi:hypothetical protein
MPMTLKERLVGGLGGAGGALVLGNLLNFVLFPQVLFWEMFLAFEIIGVCLIIMAPIIHLRD